MRNAAHIDYACINCSASADAGSPGSDDFVCQCGGAFAGAEVEDYAEYNESLSSLEGVVENDLAS